MGIGTNGTNGTTGTRRLLPFISVVIPTRNEEENLPRLLLSLGKLEYPTNKLEVVIVDGNSTDRTVKIAKNFGAKVFYNPKILRGAGCQIGVDRAKGELVAFTDADCRVPKNWLKGLLNNLNEEKIVSVGGLNITPRDDSLFAKAAGRVILLLTRAGARYGFTGGKARETFHNSGCNVLYRKEAILSAGGFDPNLITCEDHELDFRLREKGYKLFFTPDVIVDHYRRPTYKKILIQAYRFAFGRCQAIKLHHKMARWFHFMPTILLLSLGATLILGLSWPVCFFYPILVLFAFMMTSLYLWKSYGLVSFYVYFIILWLWTIGWGLGFLTNLFSRSARIFLT
jgi:cellulose synthase/poly-beta-1,6-N-acetylglucosamine synthase-like glycosyltransferase